MRALLTISYLFLAAVALVAALSIVDSGVGLYFVAAGYARPGDPIYLDELAPTIHQSSISLGVSVLVAALAVVGCITIRRKIRDRAS